MIGILNRFGGINDVLLLGLFVCSFFLISSLIRSKKWRFIFSCIASLFLALQVASLFFTQSFIGYQFYAHFNLRGITGMTSLFIPHSIGIVILFLALFFFNYYSNRVTKKLNSVLKLKIKPLYSSVFKIALISSFFAIIFFKGSFIEDTKSFLAIFYKTDSISFKEVLHKNKMYDYITPDQIECEPGKNIVIISMESLERGFLSEKYSQLTPNLNNLKNSWNYYDLEQNTGGGWTSGSLYAYLTGFPAFFGVQGNAIFQSAYYSEISSISHVLDKANYQSIYLNGNTEHSGIQEMLSTFDFDKIVDVKNVEKTGFESKYGIRDKDLFQLAKNEIDKQQNSNEPFALFISTTDTHFPDGFYDERMESVISKKDSNLEFMVAALDYMIGDFISYLKEKNLLENTAVYIFPDHLKMGDPSMFSDTGDRGLYLISNSFSEKRPVDTLHTMYQIDLPKVILEGAGIQHNLKFLTDYIKDDKEKYIKDNMLSIMEINTNGIHRFDSKPFSKESVSKDYLTYKKDTLRFIAHAGGRIDGKKYTNSKEALDLSYQKGFRLFELDIVKTKDGKYVAAHDWKHWSKATNFKGALPPSYSEFMRFKIFEKYTPLDMDSINDWFAIHKDAILITDKINDPKGFVSKFKFKDRLMMELFDMKALEAGLEAEILSAMPSQSIVNKIIKPEVASLAEMGVTHIAISREFIESNKELLLEFKRYGIKPYAFKVNFIKGIDEEYVTKYEMDYIYGIYADDWNFE